MNLVPTASTTAALAMGDALAMSVLVEKGFQPDDFANLHPGGRLGKQMKRVEQLMHTGDQVPVVHIDTRMRDVIETMTDKRLGMTCVVNGDETLAGIITDGDLRRAMAARENLAELRAADVMSSNPVVVTRSTTAAEALNILERRQITCLVVVDGRRGIEGVVHLHGLWRTGLV